MSQRLPGKNLLPLGGVPLVIHSIISAQKNKDIIDELIVTTDDPVIAKISMEMGATVISRPAHLCNETASTLSVLQHVLQSLDNEVENVILLQPTNPLRPEGLIKEAWIKFDNGSYGSLMTVSRSFLKLGKINNGSFIPYNYEMGQRSQDLEPLYFENGLLYISKAAIIKNGEILGKKNFPFIVDHPFAGVDIDEQVDLEYAEFLLKKMENKP